MTIVYTNQVRTNIIDPLHDLILTEFKPLPIIFESEFNPAHMTRGQYIRIWLLDSTELSKFANGETRQYEIEILYYFDLRRKSERIAFYDMWSDEAEHLKRLLDNNTSYNDGTYRWHNLEISTSPFQPLSELEDVENEETMGIKFTCLITRNNING
ncbi:hypothetical protein AMJ80_03520 [bacterium SM23_31]|nr:MAG: hypothetical protein AMJ80_03520 [bacterium SM23_31]